MIKREITDKRSIIFFINVGSNLADKIPPSSTDFESFLRIVTTTLSDKISTEKKFKDASFTFKTNKSLGYDNLHVNVFRSMYHELKIPLMSILINHYQQECFLIKWKPRRFHLYLKTVKNLSYPVIDQYLYFHFFGNFKTYYA